MSFLCKFAAKLIYFLLIINLKNGCLGTTLGDSNLKAETPAGWPTPSPPLSVLLSLFCLLSHCPLCPGTVCWLGGSLPPAVIVNASSSSAGAILGLPEPGHVSKTERVFVLEYVRECVCFEHPAAGSSRWVRSVITELSGSRRVFGRSGWRWRNSPRVHAGKLSAVVTCAIVGATFASITLKVEHRHRWEA